MPFGYLLADPYLVRGVFNLDADSQELHHGGDPLIDVLSYMGGPDPQNNCVLNSLKVKPVIRSIVAITELVLLVFEV
jgi:hypothetical protein